MSELTQFYLQDSRGYVGNDVLWWANEGGYTTDLSKAEIFTQEKAVKQHQCRKTDIPWPKDYIDHKTRPAVDMQYINLDEALKDTNIILAKPQKKKAEKLNCHECGQFLSEKNLWAGSCPNCGTDNRH
jgi:rubrerythrin